ncbi:MAG: glutamate mutase L, partial [Alphaproteobacteria bacterium]|nr:glutamate mutase L [Alphaproteobacteria bacterium]
MISTPQSALALLIDFGSTFTKITAVDLQGARILSQAQAPSTVNSNVSEGLVAALGVLADTVPALAARPAGLDALDTMEVWASSS